MRCAAPDPSPATTSVSLALRLSGQAAAALKDLPRRMHPGWLAALEIDASLLAAADAGLLNELLLRRFDLRWPDLSKAGHAMELAWLLPPEEFHRLCASRALFADRGALARSVDAAERRQARQLVGSAAFDVLLRQPARQPGLRRLPALDADVVVIAGWALLASQLPWHDKRAQRLAELALPPAAARARSAFAKTGPRSLGPGRTGPDAAAEHADFAAALPHLFPEHLWLFGSEPASLKSV